MNDNFNENSFPVIDDVVVDDTPAESFENLYGGSSQVNVESQSNVNPFENNVFSNTENMMNMNQEPNMNSVDNASVNVQTNVNPFENNVVSNTNDVNVVQNATFNSINNVGNVENSTVLMDNNTNVNSNVYGNSSQQVNNIDEKKMMSIEEQLSKTSQYKPEDFQQEKITIPSDNQYEKNKSNFTFLIVLGVLVGLVITVLPYIMKMFK